MKAEAKPLRFLTMEGKVKIPFFQRTYVWDEENWNQLLSEFQNETKTTNFLGSIILKQIRVGTGEPKQVEVIDGQQRLTTLSILLKALYDTFQDEIKKNFENDIKDILLYRRNYTSQEREIRIEQPYVDSEAYKQVINNFDNLPSLEKINKNSHRILRCYKYFIEELQKMDNTTKNAIINKLLSPENKMLVVIDIDENEDEQRIFDTLNTAGVRLTASEIVKNAVFQKAIQVYGNKEEVIELYHNTWETTFLKDEDTKKYWETERQTGRLKRDNIELLLHCIGVIKGFYDPDRHVLEALSKVYKDEIHKLDTKEKMKEFIDEIVKYAEIYKNKFPVIDNTTSLSFEDSINKLFHILEVLEISTFHPFILYVFKEFQNDEDKIKELLFKLEKFIIRRMIAGHSTKNYNKFCKEFIQDYNKIEEKMKETTEEDIRNGLKQMKSSKNATLLLFWIELYRRYKDNRYDTKELKYSYSLEHIMPKKWEEYWKDIPKKYKPDGTEMTEEEAKLDRNEKINWIGNMTLLTTNLNSALKNLRFEKKIEGEGRKKGIRKYADLSITKDDIIDPYDNGDKNWDEKKIEERTEKLTKEILEIWKYSI